MTNCDPRIEAYMEAVETGKVEASKDVKALMKHVRKCFETEDIYVDQQQLTDYLGLARYFPYDEVFPWQQFVIGLHDCTYWRENGRPRWPDLFCLIGRGAGKDGTIALESTALASEYNGIREYDVDICANNEDQALRPVKDIVGAFEQPKWLKKLQRFFKWTREEVVCKDTRSTIKGHTNNPGGKDGLRSGMVVLNEIHQYQDYKNISITDISNDAMDTIKNYSITALSDAKKYTDECDKLVLKDSQDYSKSYTLSEIGKLEASGGNLVKGYRFSDDNIKAYWNTAGTIKSGQNDPDGGKNAVAIVADAANCYLASKRNENTIINATGRYTVTFWAKASKAQTVTFSFNKVSESIALTTTWKKFSFIKDITSIATSGSLIIFGGSNSISTGDGTIYIYRPDVRHGYSSEDIFNLLTNNGNIQGMYMTDGKLYWNGTYIKSKSITTAALAADSVTAEKIKVDDLYSLKASIAGFKISSDTISHQSITNPESGIGQNYYDTFFSSKDKRLTFRKGPGTSDYITFDIRGLRASGGKRLNLISDAETNDSSEGFSSGAHHSMGHTNIYGNLYVADSFRTAGTKQAVRQTDNYGEKGVYCYETPTPHFGDIGSGEISEDGKCYIDIEDILKEMINTEMQYYVFLQKCGEGDLYVSECFPDYFIVTGTPGLRFFWELKAKQKGYEYNRYEGEDRVVGFRKIAYDEEYIAETEKLIEEREEI